MLCHQAQMEWLKDGDRNSKFFHAVIRDKRKKQHIQIELSNGDVTTSAADIGTMAQDFLRIYFPHLHTIWRQASLNLLRL